MSAVQDARKLPEPNLDREALVKLLEVGSRDTAPRKVTPVE